MNDTTPAQPEITLGVEEEFFLVNPDTLDLLSDPDAYVFIYSETRAGEHKIVREFLRSQIETNTKVCHSVSEVRQSLIETRQIVATAAEKFGAKIFASSMHPFAKWQDQTLTPRKRYESFSIMYQETFRRFLIGGMHIHAGFGDEETRLRVMNALRHYLPLLLALSTSSPFMEGRETGYKSTRMNIMGSLPRSGIPRAFNSHQDFENLVNEYVKRNFITDSSEFWWDIRPSHAFPTIELRICDVCTNMNDLMAVVALYACLIRHLMLHEEGLPFIHESMSEIIFENKWQAQRYGIFSFLAHPRSGERVDIEDLLRALVDSLEEDAKALDCVDELQHSLEIVKSGTSADRQLDHYRLCILNGASSQEALHEVVNHVIQETAEHLPVKQSE